MTYEPLVNETPCLVPGCKRNASVRGQCKRCYAAAARAVREEKITWEDLIKAGVATSSNRLSPFQDWLDEHEAMKETEGEESEDTEDGEAAA